MSRLRAVRLAAVAVLAVSGQALLQPSARATIGGTARGGVLPGCSVSVSCAAFKSTQGSGTATQLNDIDASCRAAAIANQKLTLTFSTSVPASGGKVLVNAYGAAFNTLWNPPQAPSGTALVFPSGTAYVCVTGTSNPWAGLSWSLS
jgi:hypothetical protein